MLYKRNEILPDSYDIIVVGGGLGGMTAANRLAKCGHKVLLLEAHNKLGGFATWFRRQGGEYTFDVSLHGFPYGMVKTCRKYWSKDIADRIEKLGEVRFINPQFNLSTDFTKEDYIKKLESHFGVDKSKALAFFDDLEKMNFYDDRKMQNKELFQKHFPDRNDIIRFLLEPMSYANGSNLEDPAISFGIVFSNFMGKGVHIFKGGTDLMINLMQEELIKNGVDIKLQTKIEKVVIDSTHSPKVSGVMVKGKLIKAKAVVSNSSLYNTIFKLAGEEYFSPDFVSKSKAVRANTSSCQVYMGLKKGFKLPYMGDLIFYSEGKNFTTEDLLSPNIIGQTFSIYYPDSRPQNDPTYTIVSSSNARFEDWVNLTQEEYKTKKDFLIKRALEGLEKVSPGLSKEVAYIDAATPCTIERYTHHYRGSSFGTKFEGLEVSMNLQKEIAGLFHAGSVGIIMSGWLGAANYGVIQAHEVDTFLSSTIGNSDEGREYAT